MKPKDSIFTKEATLIRAAHDLLGFMALQDQLDDKSSEQLAAWLKAREPECITDAEKHFILAARTFVLDYAAELARIT